MTCEGSDLVNMKKAPDVSKLHYYSTISPPFLCISLSLKNYNDSFDLIIDDNAITTLVVKGQFFRLEKIVTD